MATQNNVIVKSNCYDKEINLLKQELQLLRDYVNNLNTVNGLDIKLNYNRLNIEIPKYIDNFMKCTVGTSNSQDANGINSFSHVCLIGNAFSGEQYFYAKGDATSTGRKWNKDTTVFSSTSGGKLFQSICFLKLIDEGYIDPALPVKNYIPEFTGSYSYYLKDTCNVTYIPTNSFNNTKPGDNLFDGSLSGYPAWTGQTATDLLDNITVRDALSLNIGFPYGQTWCQPRNIKDWSETPAANSQVDKAVLCSFARHYEACWRGYFDGTPEKAKANPKAIWTPLHPELIDLSDNKKYINDSVTDYILSVVKVSNNGTVPWMYKVGDTNVGANGLKQIKGTYSGLSYAILGAVAEVAARKAGYLSSADFLRKTVLEPMGITKDQCWCTSIEEPPIGWENNIAEQQFRRTEQMSKGYLSGGVDPQMLIDISNGKFKYNQLFWASTYPNDKFASRYLPEFDPDYKTNYLQKNKYGIGFGGAYYQTLDVWAKVYSMYINKGVYNGKRFLSRAIWNYSRVTAIPAGAFYNGYTGISSQGNNNRRWTIAQGFSFVNGPTSELYLPTSYEPGASGSSPVPGCNYENSLTWSGAFGNVYYIDFDTGLYIFQVNHVSSAGNRAKAVSDVGLVPYCI